MKISEIVEDNGRTVVVNDNELRMPELISVTMTTQCTVIGQRSPLYMQITDFLSPVHTGDYSHRFRRL